MQHRVIRSVQSRTQTGTVITLVGRGLLQRKFAEYRHECEGRPQRAAVNSSRVSDVPPIVHEVLRSPGQPLDPATRAFMEPRFGHDFSQVRGHTDAKAPESARAVLGGRER